MAEAHHTKRATRELPAQRHAQVCAPHRHGTNAFIRDGDSVFRTYFINSRGDEAMGSTWSYLDMTALGRQEEWEDSPEGYPQTPPYEWWIWHDEPHRRIPIDPPGLGLKRPLRRATCGHSESPVRSRIANSNRGRRRMRLTPARGRAEPMGDLGYGIIVDPGWPRRTIATGPGRP